MYRGKTARALLQEWREDLLHRTAGRVYAPFQNDYQLLALLEERLPSGQSADHWRSLAESCRSESPAARDVPSHLEKATRAVPLGPQNCGLCLKRGEKLEPKETRTLAKPSSPR